MCKFIYNIRWGLENILAGKWMKNGDTLMVGQAEGHKNQRFIETVRYNKCTSCPRPNGHTVIILNSV